MKKTLHEHFDPENGEKRILALDGGGIRGALTLGFLEEIEEILRNKYKDQDLRLCDYFDLIGGTSTGAIIAAALALGYDVKTIKEKYFELGNVIFKNKWWKIWTFPRKILKFKYPEKKFESILNDFFGDKTLSSNEIKTGLCIITKRIDSGSVWPIINHPEGKFYTENCNYLVKDLIRASTAAPSYFQPKRLKIIDQESKKEFDGTFVDGGVSTDLNPSLKLFLIATLEGFPFHWSCGEDKLMIVSLGTGSHYFNFDKSRFHRKTNLFWGINLPDFYMDDISWHNQTLMQYFSNSVTNYNIDSEIGNLENDLICETPLFKYLRYNVMLEPDELRKIGLDNYIEKPGLKSLRKMDKGKNATALYTIGKNAAKQIVTRDHFD